MNFTKDDSSNLSMANETVKKANQESDGEMRKQGPYSTHKKNTTVNKGNQLAAIYVYVLNLRSQTIKPVDINLQYSKQPR